MPSVFAKAAVTRSRKVRRSSERQQRVDPLAYTRYTDPQRAFEFDERALVLWRDGNQLGKSHSLARFTSLFAQGRMPVCGKWAHPYKILVIGYSYAQMDPLLEKLWAALPKDRVSPEVSYRSRCGFTGHKNQFIEIYATPEDVAKPPDQRKLLALIYFSTYEAGAQAIMGDSVHLLVLDEPPPSDVYGEALARIAHFDGLLRIGFTPTPKSPSLVYLKDQVKKGKIHQHNHGVSERNCTIRGGLLDRPLRNQAQIDRWKDRLLAHEVGMRVNGDWHPKLDGLWLPTFGDHNIREFRLGRGLGPPPGAKLCVATDHGIQSGKQASMLVAVVDGHTLDPWIWWIDETASTGATTEDEDAKEILAMLDRNGLTYWNIDEWVGDKAVKSSSYTKGRRYKSNARLRRFLARCLSTKAAPVSHEDLKWIAEPEKYPGSVEDGMRTLKSLFKQLRPGPGNTGRCLVHPRCTRFIEFCRTWRGDPKDPVKDAGDAGRYGFEKLVSLENFRGVTVFG